jgi:hypothetical protein
VVLADAHVVKDQLGLPTSRGIGRRGKYDKYEYCVGCRTELFSIPTGDGRISLTLNLIRHVIL